MKVSLRMRLSARIIRDDQTSEAFHALNEIVIDRGEFTWFALAVAPCFGWRVIVKSRCVELSDQRDQDFGVVMLRLVCFFETLLRGAV